MKVLLAVPVTDPPSFPTEWVQRFADLVVHEVGRGTELRSLFQSAYCVAEARNIAIRRALDRESDAVLWLDSDVVPPADVVERLSGWGEPVVSGWYRCKGLGKNGWPPSATRDGAFIRPEGDGLVEVDQVGFGVLWTSCSVFRALDDPWVEHGEGPYGSLEDFAFCDRLRDAGFRILADPTVACDHWFSPGPFYIDPEGRLVPRRRATLDAAKRARLGYAVKAGVE